ncbi:MAG: lipid II:glycine glycyltransferase (peptidoglycan interpeptide bridge formation enzyme) [Saprospiraceae bacterium]|jgi:lipid II:glycine glycyltransferase (peptidoglycan interpeptide bridge formation enzyme)
MNLVARENIDIKKWDACIEASSSLPYAYSWYLDGMCLTWSALIIEKNNEYTVCFPIPWKIKLGIKYVYPPFFIQQLGLYCINGDVDTQSFIQKVTDEFKWVEMYLSSKVDRAEVRCNMVLKLDEPYEKLLLGYSTNHKRNLKKASKVGIRIEDSDDAECAIKLFLEDKGSLFPHLKKEHYDAFHVVCKKAASLGKFQVLNAVGTGGQVICSALFFITKARIVFAFSGNSVEGKDAAALFVLLDEIIKRNQNKSVTLDFEGSENEGLQRFYKGFGASQEDYYYFKNSRLPFPLNLVKK